MHYMCGKSTMNRGVNCSRWGPQDAQRGAGSVRWHFQGRLKGWRGGDRPAQRRECRLDLRSPPGVAAFTPGRPRHCICEPAQQRLHTVPPLCCAARRTPVCAGWSGNPGTAAASRDMLLA